MTSRMLGVWTAVLAGLQVIAAAGNLADLLPPPAAAWFVLVVGAVQVATATSTGSVAALPADIKVGRYSMGPRRRPPSS